MTGDILQNILNEESQAAAAHLEAQQTANEIVKNAESRVGEEERKAAVAHRALYQSLLDERRKQVDARLLSQQQAEQEKVSVQIEQARVNLDQAVSYIVNEVINGHR